MAINGILGFAMLIAILFCAGDVNAALKSPTGYPFIEIFQQATQSTGGATAMTAVIASMLIFGAIGILATASRMLWAFARDNGVPYSDYVGRVSRSAVPTNLVLMSRQRSMLARRFPSTPSWHRLYSACCWP